MSVRKQGRFEALCYDARSRIPFLKFRGRLDINKQRYDVDVEQGSDGSVSIDLSANDVFFNFILCPRGLVAIRNYGRDDSFISKSEFMEKAGMSDSDVAGLAKILKKEAVSFFGPSVTTLPASLEYLRSKQPYISQFFAVLQKNLEPLLDELEADSKDKNQIYRSILNSYAQFRRSDAGQ